MKPETKRIINIISKYVMTLVFFIVIFGIIIIMNCDTPPHLRTLPVSCEKVNNDLLFIILGIFVPIGGIASLAYIKTYKKY